MHRTELLARDPKPCQHTCLELFGGHLRFDVLSPLHVEAGSLAALSLSLNRRGVLFFPLGEFSQPAELLEVARDS